MADPVPQSVVHFLAKRDGWLTLEPDAQARFIVRIHVRRELRHLEGDFETFDDALNHSIRVAQQFGLSIAMAFTPGAES